MFMLLVINRIIIYKNTLTRYLLPRCNEYLIIPDQNIAKKIFLVKYISLKDIRKSKEV